MHYEPSFIAELVALRHTLHQYPEAAFEEVATAAAVEAYLQQCNMDEIHTGIGQTGIVALIKGQRPGKMIALRADMDALPMQEGHDASQVEYCSKIAGRFHGCGHDGHTVMLLGAAKLLGKHRDFAGTLVFIFQCAEENFWAHQRCSTMDFINVFPSKKFMVCTICPVVHEGLLR